MAHMMNDANGRSIPDGLRPKPSTSYIISATLTSSVQTLAMPTLVYNENSQGMIRLSASDQGVLYAIGPAGGAYTGITDMTLLPPNCTERIKVHATDTKIYVLQFGVGGKFQACTLD